MEKRITPIATTLRLIAFLSLMMVAGPVVGQTTHTITVRNNTFSPKDLNISVGDIVVWNCTQGVHNVNGKQSTFPNNQESFGNSVGSNWTYSYTFTKPGKNDYRCDPHVGLGMVGTITVSESQNQTELKIRFSGMTPHLGQLLVVYVVDMEQGLAVDTLSLESIPSSDFQLISTALEIGKSYHIDLFADHNGNGEYDAPPVDHAWRLPLNNVQGDVVLDFVHNTNFTDIFDTSGVKELENLELRIYPNPVVDQIFLDFKGIAPSGSRLYIHSITGQEIQSIPLENQTERMNIDLSSEKPGLYFLSIEWNKQKVVHRLIKK